MLIYVDLLFVVNIFIDYILLMTLSMVLKKNISHRRLFISSFVGGCSTFLIFINNKPLVLLFKIITCIAMMLIYEKYKGIKFLFENILYFYMLSIVLAGTIYLLKDNYNSEINIVLLFLITPITMKIYNDKVKKLNTYYKERYDVLLIYKNKKYELNGYVDTGNNLYDQYKKRPVVLVYNKNIKYKYEEVILVPMETANNTTLIKCIKPDKLIVDGKEKKNVLVGLSPKKFKIQDINIILHKDIIGGLWLLYYC